MAGDSKHKDLRVGDIVYRYEAHVYPEVDKNEVGFIVSTEKNAFGYVSYNVEFADSTELLCAHQLVLADLWLRRGRGENEWEKKRS